MSCAYAMQAIGSYGAGLIDIEELHKIKCNALTGSGACGTYPFWTGHALHAEPELNYSQTSNIFRPFLANVQLNITFRNGV